MDHNRTMCLRTWSGYLRGFLQSLNRSSHAKSEEAPLAIGCNYLSREGKGKGSTTMSRIHSQMF